MANNSCGKKSAGFFSLPCFRILLAAFVFVLGMMGTRIVNAASVTETVTGTNKGVTVSMKVTLQNVDLKAYSKYNYVLKNGHPDHIFAKAIPGKEVSITITPTSTGKKIDGSSIDFRSYQLLPNSSKEVDYKDFQNRKSVVSGSYVIPKTADIVDTMVLLHYGPFDFKDGSLGQVSVTRQYYICTSDEAFKKAYKLLTGKMLTEPISSDTAKNETKKNDSKKATDKNIPDKTDNQPAAKSDDSGGLGTVGKVGIGVAAAGAIAFGASQLLGGGGAGAGAGGAAETAPSEPESFVYTDPATGAQTLYEKDPNTGEWFDPSTGAVTDPGRLEDFKRQRMKDRAWMNDQMDNMRNRTTQTDRILQSDQEKLRQTFDEIDRQGAKDKAAIRSGTYGMSDAERTEYLNKRQENLESKQTAAHRTAKNWDRAVKAAETVQTAADIGVDVLSTVTAPVGGKVIGDGYAMAKNIAGSTSDAVANGRSVLGGIAKGIADGAVDVAQNNASGVYKTLSYIGGDAFKGGLDAAYKGENVLKGTFKGGLKGTTKLTIDVIGNKISANIDASKEKSLKDAWNHAKDIRKRLSPQISQKSVKALQKMNIERHLANMAKAEHQTMANTITNAVVKNTLPDAMFGD